MNNSSLSHRFIYPVVTILFITVITLTIFVVVRDLKKNIDTITTLTVVSEKKELLETEHYSILKKKLSLPEVAPRGEIITPVTEQNQLEDVPLQDIVLQPEEKPPVDFSAFTVRIYNASGITGLAGKVKTTLSGVEFSNIETGNIGSQTRNEIYVRSDIRDDVIKKLQNTMPSLFTDGDIMEKDPSSADIVIILGHE